MTDLEARYGRRATHPAGRRTALAWTGIAALVAVVVAFGLWWWSAQDPYSARVLNFAVDSDTQARATVEVRNSADQAVRCEIVAKDRFTLPVGVTIVETPTEPGTTNVQASLTTIGRAVTVVLGDCTGSAARVP